MLARSPVTRPRAETSAGASLVEVMLAVAVLAILLAVALPGWATADYAAARNLGHALVAEVRLARQYAIARQEYCGVEIEAGQERYGIVCRPGAGAGGELPVRPPETMHPVVEIRPGSLSAVYYRPDGLVQSSYAGAIDLQAHRGGPIYRITVRQTTGEVTLCPAEEQPNGTVTCL